MNVTRRLQAIDAKRRQILDAAAALSPAALATKPDPGSWSVLQVIEHLVVAEVAVMGDMTDVDLRPPRRRKPRHVIRYAMVMAVLRLGIRVSIPSGTMAPTGTRPLADLRQQWEQQHQTLQALVARMDRAGLRRAIFRHPVAGPITMLQAIRMLDAHIEAHRRQLRRITDQLGAEPGPAAA